MGISKESLVDLQERYERAYKLVKEDSRLDPETDPYRSKYAARDVLLEMDSNIKNLILSEPDESQDILQKLTGMQAVVQLMLGRIASDTEELSAAADHFNRCLNMMTGRESDRLFVLIYLSLHNQLGILHSKQERPTMSKEYFEKAETYYKEFIKNKKEDPIEMGEIFIPNIESHNTELAHQKLEKEHTLTLYYLAQTYKILEDTLKSAVYFHVTLRRMLESKKYDPIDWALNNATLSQVFVEMNGFKQARHHLAAASYMLDLYEKELNELNDNSEETEAKKETFKHRSADVARCWAKYGIVLLSSSKERLMNHTEDIDSRCSQKTDLSQRNLDQNSSVKKEDLQNLLYPSLDLSEFEKQVTDQFILVLQDGKKLFLSIQKWLQCAQNYYTLQSLASDYLELVQDHAQAYEYLLFFDENSDNQTKYYKRAADLLEEAVKSVNPTYYTNYCRSIWYKLAQIYMEMFNIKSEKYAAQSQAVKINNLIDKSIMHYYNYIKSFKGYEENFLAAVSDDMLKPFLLAFFHIGALYRRYVIAEKEEQLEANEWSLFCYEKLVEFSGKHEKVAKLIPAELTIAREFLMLLPRRIRLVANSSSFPAYFGSNKSK